MDPEDWREPPDELEDSDREKMLKYMARLRSVLDSALSHILDSEDSEVAAWQVAFAIEYPGCMGLTMAQKGAELGVGRAAISKGATAFCRIANLPPSKYMLPESARESYRELREEQERERNNKQ